MSTADMSSEDAAEGDATTGSAGYVATPTEVGSAATDPDLNVPVDPGLAPAASPTTTSTTTATTTTATATSTATVPAPTALVP